MTNPTIDSNTSAKHQEALQEQLMDALCRVSPQAVERTIKLGADPSKGIKIIKGRIEFKKSFMLFFLERVAMAIRVNETEQWERWDAFEKCYDLLRPHTNVYQKNEIKESEGLMGAAVSEGWPTPMIKKIIQNYDLTFCNPRRRPPLGVAIAMNDVKIMDLLLDHLQFEKLSAPERQSFFGNENALFLAVEFRAWEAFLKIAPYFPTTPKNQDFGSKQKVSILHAFLRDLRPSLEDSKTQQVIQSILKDPTYPLEESYDGKTALEFTRSKGLTMAESLISSIIEKRELEKHLSSVPLSSAGENSKATPAKHKAL